MGWQNPPADGGGDASAASEILDVVRVSEARD